MFDARILLREEDTAGAVGAVEVTVPAGWRGPPLQHHAFAEAFYVRDVPETIVVGGPIGPG